MDGYGGKESKFDEIHDGGICIGAAPVVAVEVAEGHNAIFGPLWISISVVLYGAHCHGWKGFSHFVCNLFVLLLRDGYPSR